ncbi:cysteine--tRNA ligase [Candidatus Falkowbacteria bacterium]|uniref:Cysteine--tRNA ligase n=1 Tax=Candidatus Falkowbacteria bacterium CG10_big_fil_rev_8_21_14_0_10_37_18 TaxID=1974562 RepID=A0A2H0V945_9BACT|nr:cysteine--tRNA ligase [Candidatus Falkowbacteria bacterium]NCQ12676.1 cysteine--tRNA ligase [Candidatus Falkowbacteria bacterium]OIO06245.1 MAG: cysteine--tRNA ligase [Candidatus Falkowbacteria bacterium CG1_02_37_21]PIR95634.1 MAG: cysteine--tRNA ligase [Candidatus Falkowbacteria bacterium CG10_big_fil_rev_8_21_14_0_10_37_18]
MAPLFLYNTLSRQKEEFKPIVKGSVGLYTCGPTVYNYAHIGNLRAYLFEDFLRRILEFNDYKVKQVMNITDVGHLVGDMDMGEDKMEKGATREGKSAWDIAAFYADSFKKDLIALNILEPSVWCKATDNIPEQIKLIQTLEEKGFVYKTSDGLYFDTSLVPDYNKLSHLPLADLKEGARIEKNPEKKNPTDFALWKFSPVDAKRQMEWDSPWGIGFPGWHIECSAMSMKFLDKQLDIHCGGVDHINIHHTNEIAQSEAATGHKFFNYWLHGAFLNISGGKRMAKSADNFLTLNNVLIQKGINPLAYRFAALQIHYRKPMEYSEAGLKQAALGLNSLFSQVASLGNEVGVLDNKLRQEFLTVINDDLNLPKALALVSMVMKAKLSAADKLATILDFDKVLGLDLDKAKNFVAADIKLEELPAEVKELVLDRQKAREAKDWAEADRLRQEIDSRGYIMEDSAETYRLTKKI